VGPVPDTRETVWGEIQGRTITFPMVVADMNAATLLYTVPLDAARAVLPGDAFEIEATGADEAQFVMALCDYKQNPWGDYNEINLGFLVRPTGGRDDQVGSFMYRMPVDQEFTCEAGNKVMGLPKTVEKVEARYGEAGQVQFDLVFGGQPTLRVTFPRAQPMGDSAAVESESYAYLDGVPVATTLRMEMGSGLIDPADVVVEVGEGPVADELRTLGLPDLEPDLVTWGEGLRGTFLTPHRVE
jgi:hypothetical protein